MDSIKDTFSEKDPAEKVLLAFDFAHLTSAVLTPVFTVTRKAGADDPSPGSILDGSAVTSGSKAVQMVRGGVDGTDYLIRCSVTDGSGQLFVMVGTLPVRRFT